ncbi:MAG: UDP-N-acetylglucosamine 2-epimerase (non-hydrolyzing) [Bdellovibrionales bacterium]|nr:UDP-N-acetylglucosamine 2-epimerase (non-hydrolyzing) [Bdellovibrionales bacterium]
MPTLPQDHRVAVIAGARPNFMKIAPLMRAMERRAVPSVLVHTGQHYDREMSDIFFDELDIPRPDVSLEIGSNSHGRQTGAIMAAFEDFADRERPSWVVVVGDVNSTIACALVAAKMGIKVCHVEAGLRSHDWSMPEEINRVLTDRLSDLLLTHSPGAEENLLREGIAADRIVYVGNVMIDTLFHLLPRAKSSPILSRLDVSPHCYALCTVHRPSNVDTPESLANIVQIIEAASSNLTVVFPIHPRTRGRLAHFGMLSRLEENDQVRMTDPLGYIDCLALSSQSRVVLTDSGGLQEETTALGVPCLTLRENTERPVTVSHGSNQIVGTELGRVVAALEQVLQCPQQNRTASRRPEFWDGKAAERSVDALLRAMKS